VYDWLWHSHINGPEEIPEKSININQAGLIDESITVRLAPIFALIIRLTQHLY
jgi:hypothetical protein